MRHAWTAVGLGLLFGGCASTTTQILSAPLFTVDVDRSWELADVMESPVQGHVFRNTDGIEVRVFAWLDSYPSQAATELVDRELRRHASTRRMVMPMPDRACAPARHRVRVMDTDADVRAHLAWDGQYTMLVGGRGNGTLIGAVARDRRVNGCLDATALAASLQGLLSGIHPTDPTVPPPPTLKPVPLPGRE